MTPAFRIYSRVFAACVLTGLAMVAALNLLVDPLGAYPRVSLKAIAPYRSQLMSRSAKAEMLFRHRCDVLLLGSSRVQAGIPVNHPAYGTSNVLNLGLAGTSLPEIAGVLEFALCHQRPKRVLLGADFFLFSDVRGAGSDFENSRFNPELQPFDYHFKNVLGSQTAGDSWLLLRQWLRHETRPESGRGFLSKSLRRGASQRESFARSIRRFLTEPEVYGAYHYSQARLDVLRQIVRQCREAQVELLVFIPPVHALELETVRAAGLWPTLERWKTDLARILAEEGASDRVPFWDFTGFANALGEDVPAAGDTTTRMRWHFEQSHVTPALGQLVLDRLLSRESPGTEWAGFGEKLTTNNVAAHLARLRGERDAYAASHSSEIEWINHLAAEVKRTRASAENASQSRNSRGGG
jgi:hypothetical protein